MKIALSQSSKSDCMGKSASKVLSFTWARIQSHPYHWWEVYNYFGYEAITRFFNMKENFNKTNNVSKFAQENNSRDFVYH